jgi:Asp-tRNA(Asn)/Glu-tRNA(Gln) amidotransferase A subunit family amidase
VSRAASSSAPQSGAAAIIRSLRSGQLTHSQMMQCYLDRIRRWEPLAHALVERVPDEILIRRSESARGPLFGLPVAVKDVIDTEQLPTQHGSAIYRGHRPRADAACVAALRAKGAVVLAKTTTTELACGDAVVTRNPYDLSRSPGGSSAGSAAAVCARMADIALGTQTAGSTIRPASYCGVVGYVASAGAFSLRGVLPLSQSADALGVLCHTVADVRLVRAALSGGARSRRRSARPARRPRLAVFDASILAPVDDAMLNALGTAVRHLERSGIEVRHFPGERRVAEAGELYDEVTGFEIARGPLREHSQGNSQLGNGVLTYLQACSLVSRRQYQIAAARARIVARQVTEALEGFDAVIMPGATGAAPSHDHGTGSFRLSAPWQLLGFPAVALPGHLDPQGMPLGMQFLTTRLRDDELIDVASHVERLFPRLPPPRLPSNSELAR